MKTSPSTLPKLLESKLTAIQQLCRVHKIKYLWVIGSALTNEFKPDSDIDFLHEWDEPNLSDEEYLDNEAAFLESLSLLLERKIDFVHYPSLKNPYLLKEIEKTKVLLYAQRPQEVSV